MNDLLSLLAQVRKGGSCKMTEQERDNYFRMVRLYCDLTNQKMSLVVTCHKEAWCAKVEKFLKGAGVLK